MYAEINNRIVRYQLAAGEVALTAAPTAIIAGLPLTGDHPMHPIAIDSAGNLYVDLGSATNVCQVANRIPHSAGIQSCTELETRAGTSRYDANKTDQLDCQLNQYRNKFVQTPSAVAPSRAMFGRASLV